MHRAEDQLHWGSGVLEHLGFPGVLSTERSFFMPISIILQQQEQEVAAVDAA